MPDTLAVYDPANRELCTVASAFAARPAAVLDIQFDADLEGREVAPGTSLATVTWSDGAREPMAAPEGCAGRVIYANRRVDYDRIQEPPAQVLVRLG